MNALEPQLEHNRIEEARLVRRKRKLLLLLIVGAPPVLFIVPQDSAPTAWVVLLIAFAMGVGYIEFRRFQLFRRDVRERRESTGGRDHP